MLLGSFLAYIFKSDYDRNRVQQNLDRLRTVGTSTIPPFTMHELQSCLQKMKNRKCPDGFGIVAEMLKQASMLLLDTYLQCFNSMLQSGELDPTWYETFVAMIPKDGKTDDVSNWRPIAILRTSYKLFFTFASSTTCPCTK